MAFASTKTDGLSERRMTYLRATSVLRRFRRLPPHRAVIDLLRAVRLFVSAPPQRPQTPREERIVVSLTTIPERTETLMPVLRSLLDQTCRADRIVLAWPSHCQRSGRIYPDPPELPEGVEVLRCDDLGPATKLLPVLKEEPDAIIVVVDDDVIYPATMIEQLLEAHRGNREVVFGWRGWTVDPEADPRELKHVFASAVREPSRVDVLLASWGYLVPPGALDEAVHDYSEAPPEMRWVDDIWIAGHLARRGVERWVIKARSLPIDTPASLTAALNRGVNSDGRNERVGIATFKAWWGGYDAAEAAEG